MSNPISTLSDANTDNDIPELEVDEVLDQQVTIDGAPVTFDLEVTPA